MHGPERATSKPLTILEHEREHAPTPLLAHAEDTEDREAEHDEVEHEHGRPHPCKVYPPYIPDPTRRQSSDAWHCIQKQSCSQIPLG